MNIVIITRTVAVALVLVLVLTATGLWAAGAEEEAPAAAADKETVFDPATGMTWTAPEYGGTLTWPAVVYPENSDPWWVGGWAPHFISGVNEPLAFADWAISRDIWNGREYNVHIPETTRGALAESWSMPDDTTFIWNIRQGVYWDDKAPVNGREFDAYDVEWTYHRYLGMGDFTEDGPSANWATFVSRVKIESVTATDKWTVVVKLTEPQLLVMQKLLDNQWFALPREVVEKYGDYKDWRNAVGTGPWSLTDLVEGSSVTWAKNPNYWGYDEKFPENRLPYIDELRSLLIPEMSARLAGLRTGKLDMMSATGDARIYSVDDLESLQATNPEIDVWPAYGMEGGMFYFNLALLPTDNVNVRKALQMAVDRETISATFHKGWGDPAPLGLIQQTDVGWSWQYEDWPDDVRQEYTYNPERAEELLDEAGFPRGADGYRFKVGLAHFDRWDPAYPELVMGYFDAIGVDGELVVQTYPEHKAGYTADTHGWAAVTSNHGYYGRSLVPLARQIQNVDNFSYSKVNDPRMVALYEAGKETLDVEELKSIIRQTDEIFVREHWGLAKSLSPQFAVSQPWVEGYFGEASMGRGERNTFQARLWIDSQLKAATGH